MHFPLHRAAQAGDLDAVNAILAALVQDGRLPTNEPDDEGKSAIFYAQVAGHEAIVNILAEAGWTKMPQGNLFTSGSGRPMFWQYDGAAVKAPRVASPFPHSKATSQSSSLLMRFIKKPLGLDAQPPVRSPALRAASKRAHRQHQKAFAAVQAGSQYNAVGAAHQLYVRKQQGTQKKSRRPALNTRDWSWGVRVAGNEILATGQEAVEGQLEIEEELRSAVGIKDVDEDGEEGAAWLRGVVAPMHERTLANVARFVAHRKPARNYDGGWVVVAPGAIQASGEEWPALAGRYVGTRGRGRAPPMAPPRDASGVQDAEWELL